MAAADMVIRREEKRSIKRPLTSEERAATAMQLVEAMQDLEDKTLAEVERRRQAKARIEVAHWEVQKLASAVRDGQVTEELDVRVVLDLEANRLTVTRDDPARGIVNIVVEERALTGPEREVELKRREDNAQAALPLPVPGTTMSPEPGPDGDPGMTDDGPDPFDDDHGHEPGAVAGEPLAWCGLCEHQHAVATADDNGKPIVVRKCVTCGCESWGDPKTVAADPRCSDCDHHYGRKGQRLRKGIPLHSRESGACGCGCDAMIPYYQRDAAGAAMLMPESERA